MAAGRPSVGPLIRLFSFTVPKSEVRARFSIGGAPAVEVDVPPGIASGDAPAPKPPKPAGELPSPWNRPLPPAAQSDVEVPLLRIAWARSGDKGNTSNIGVIARSGALLPYLLREVTTDAVADYLSHYVKGTVTRYPVPGIRAVNFLLTEALDGGGMASLRNDPLGKAMGQILLGMPVRVPAELVPTP